MGRSASDGSIRFAVFIGVRNALIVIIDINDRVTGREVNHRLTTSRLVRFLPRSLGVGTVEDVFAGVLAFESSGVGGIAGVCAGVGITGASGVGIIPSEVSQSGS